MALKIIEDPAVALKVTTDSVKFKKETEYLEVSVPAYTGEYTFDPTEDEQTIEIQGKQATQNITIGPIPTTYGRLTWDGTRLKIS